MREQLRLDFAPPHSRPPKKHETLDVVAPLCAACTEKGATRRDWSCKACVTAYQRAYSVARPEVRAASQERARQRSRETRPEAQAKRAKTFRQRYRADPAFRDRMNEKWRAWAAAHAEYMADKRRREAGRRGFKKLTHEPLVYFIRSHLTALIKIGTTTGLASRLSDLRSAHPGRLEVLGVMQGGMDVEAAVHRTFAGQRYDREWFVETPALREFIRANATHPVPELGGVGLAPGKSHRGRKPRSKAAGQVEVESFQ